MTDIRRRIEALEHGTPKAIVLKLADGANYLYKDEPRFFAQGMEEIRAQEGPLYDALRQTVSATNCGRLWEVLVALASGPIDCGGVPTPAPRAGPVCSENPTDTEGESTLIRQVKGAMETCSQNQVISEAEKEKGDI